MHHRNGVKHSLAGAVALAVMIFNIAHLCVFAYMEGVNAVVLRKMLAVVMNSASRNYVYIAIIAYIKIIVNQIFEIGFAHNNGNVHILAFCAGFNIYFNSGAVWLWHNFYVFRAVALYALPV